MVALCLDEGDHPNFHEEDIQEAEKLVSDMDDHGESTTLECRLLKVIIS